jgi:hypothetical protein
MDKDTGCAAKTHFTVYKAYHSRGF